MVILSMEMNANYVTQLALLVKPLTLMTLAWPAMEPKSSIKVNALNPALRITTIT
jgi:hypothetical protein